jgi:hypothetical protein
VITATKIASSSKEFLSTEQKAYTVNLLTAPNPAETQIGLRFHLPQEATVSVEVLDALQRRVLLPVNTEHRDFGTYELSIPVGNLTNGAYSVRLRAILSNGVILFQQLSLIIAR